MPATKPKLKDRLHVPTEEEIEECKRLFLTCENAEKTLLGDKTQTRRILENDVQERLDALSGRTTADIESPLRFFYSEDGWNGAGWYACLEEYPGEGCEWVGTREYEPGEIRLVTTPHWRAHTATEKDRIYDPGTDCVRFRESSPGPGVNAICIPDDDFSPTKGEHDWHQIHASHLMPKWASRIAVEVKAVRFERVQDISQEDALAEGMYGKYLNSEEDREFADAEHVYGNKYGYTAIQQLRDLWNELHGEDAWEDDDWVRCIEYELVT